MSVYLIEHADGNTTLVSNSMTRLLIVAEVLNLDKVKCICLAKENK